MPSSLHALSLSPLLCLALAGTALAQEPGRFPADAGVIDVTGPLWGAIPDDGLDDSAAIQRNFDLMTPSSKIVYFPDGQYDLAKPLELAKKDIEARAVDLEYTGWEKRVVEGRDALVAVAAGTGPEDAGRITYRFDAISGKRRVRFSIPV